MLEYHVDRLIGTCGRGSHILLLQILENIRRGILTDPKYDVPCVTCGTQTSYKFWLNQRKKAKRTVRQNSGPEERIVRLTLINVKAIIGRQTKNYGFR